MNWKTQIFADEDKKKKYRRFESINADKKKRNEELVEYKIAMVVSVLEVVGVCEEKTTRTGTDEHGHHTDE